MANFTLSKKALVGGVTMKPLVIPIDFINVDKEIYHVSASYAYTEPGGGAPGPQLVGQALVGNVLIVQNISIDTFDNIAVDFCDLTQLPADVFGQGAKILFSALIARSDHFDWYANEMRLGLQKCAIVLTPAYIETVDTKGQATQTIGFLNVSGNDLRKGSDFDLVSPSDASKRRYGNR